MGQQNHNRFIGLKKLSDRLLEDIVALMNAREGPAKKRGPYKKKPLQISN